MFSCHEWLSRAAGVLALVLLPFASLAQSPFPGIGRLATSAELAAWDIDVRPDFKGLPKGSGSVARGMEVWESQCASCHGVFGESNEVFAPLVGGTTREDIKTGRAQRLNDASFPGRTMLMKLSTLSTLWDYINRAMPWNAPKSLSTDEVYAVTAYLLNLGDIVPEGYVLSDATMAEVQQRLPNRHGATWDHGLWPGSGMGNGGQPDVKPLACMKACGLEPKVVSSLPGFARNDHGNLAQQQRLVGPQRGVDTRPAAVREKEAAVANVGVSAAAPSAAANPATATAAAAAAVSSAVGSDSALALAARHACTACHGMEKKIVGPGFSEIFAKHAHRPDLEAYLYTKIRSGGQGTWGKVTMPAQTLPDSDARLIAQWLAAGAQR